MTNITHLTIVIDVFRAFSTACYILNSNPQRYYLTPHCHAVAERQQKHPNAILVGKPEIGSTLGYHIPNSPHRCHDLALENQTVIHRTQAGATGVIEALSKPGEQVLACSFNNAKATANVIKTLAIKKLTIRAMGHEATSPSIEDDVCARYLNALLADEPFDLKTHQKEIKNTTGQYFLTEDQQQYPSADLSHCLTPNLYNFAIAALPRGDFAELVRLEPSHSSRPPHQLAQSAPS